MMWDRYRAMVRHRDGSGNRVRNRDMVRHRKWDRNRCIWFVNRNRNR